MGAPDPTDLYQEVLLDHYRAPRNYGHIEGATCTAEGDNPLCGDHVTVWVTVADGVVTDARFEGDGCAISTAAASLMTEAVKGKTLAEVEELYGVLHGLVTGDPAGADAPGPDPGKLTVFSGVREFPSRVKCATLAWHTLRAALSGAAGPKADR
ncbi:MAG: Fe-S cluster assembly sulfur transfer protein SufU [Anaerolineae bacterium]